MGADGCRGSRDIALWRLFQCLCKGEIRAEHVEMSALGLSNRAFTTSLSFQVNLEQATQDFVNCCAGDQRTASVGFFAEQANDLRRRAIWPLKPEAMSNSLLMAFRETGIL